MIHGKWAMQKTMKSRGQVSGSGFTLLELIISLALLAATSLIAFTTFWSVSRAYKKGTALSDDINHGDFVIDQLAMGLRSAYFPDAGHKSQMYGFWLEDSGSDESAADSISWVKLGGALAEDENKFAGGPHRVQFFIADDPEYGKSAAVRIWRPYQQSEEFDYKTDIEPVILSSKVKAFSCRVATNLADAEIEWEDEWEATNTLPGAVEITVFLEPVEEGGSRVAMKRLVPIPVAKRLWKW